MVANLLVSFVKYKSNTENVKNQYTDISTF